MIHERGVIRTSKARNLTASSGHFRWVIRNDRVDSQHVCPPYPLRIVNSPDHWTQIKFPRRKDRIASHNQSIQENLIGSTVDCRRDHSARAHELSGGVPRLEQGAGANPGVNLFNEGKRVQIETDDYNARAKFKFIDTLSYRMYKFIRRLLSLICLQLNIDDSFAARVFIEETKDMFECGNKLPSVFLMRELRIRPIEPTANIDFAQLG